MPVTGVPPLKRWCRFGNWPTSKRHAIEHLGETVHRVRNQTGLYFLVEARNLRHGHGHALKEAHLPVFLTES